MPPDSDTETDIADAYIRLDFIWEDHFEDDKEWLGSKVERSITDGSLSHMIYSTSIDQNANDIEVGVVTTETKVVEQEVTGYQDEIRRVINKNLDGEHDPGEADKVYVSAVTLGNKDGARPVRSTHPSVKYALNQSEYPDNITEHELEKTARSKTDKKVDVIESSNGFNMWVREPGITQAEARRVRDIIIEREDGILNQPIRIVYTAPQSENLVGDVG